MVARLEFRDLRLNSSQLNDVLKGPSGPAVRHTQQRAQDVKRGAQHRVGKKTGKLANAIVTRTGADTRGPFVAVGTFDGGEGYALYHHEGTRPHLILPNRARVLSFEVGGVRVFAASVDHPGTRPNRYLIDAARGEGLNIRGGLF